MRAAKVDANQPEIVARYRMHGCSVQHLHAIPAALDILVGIAGVDCRVEIKDGSKPPSAQRLTESEQKIFGEWRGNHPKLVKNIDDVDAHVAEMIRMGRRMRG